MGRVASTRRKTRNPQPVGSVLEGLFRRLGITRKVDQYSVVADWESIVGEKIAGATSVRRVDHGVLLVDVKNSAWRTELVMRKLEIMEKIHKKMGKKVLKDIRFY